MQYQLFVQNQPNSKYVASIVGIPNSSVEGDTREEAIEKVKVLLAEKVANGELITVEINPAVESKAPSRRMGLLENDPTFDDFMEKLAAIRREANSIQDEE
jgi:predicted RNase H-like HicB family nuclease